MPLTNFFRKSAGPGFDVQVLICKTFVLLVLPTSTSPFQTFDPEVLKSPLEDDHEGGNGPKAAPTTATKAGGTGGASVDQSTSLDSGPSSGNGANQQQGKPHSQVAAGLATNSIVFCFLFVKTH